mmetsp:Transcript_27444/g.53949  ORF Transcript_27444/g.53949 Transcript_27444/m.53949 type:complete len:204 (+) Transcript_27444:1338-1949(+)
MRQEVHLRRYQVLQTRYLLHQLGTQALDGSNDSSFAGVKEVEGDGEAIGLLAVGDELGCKYRLAAAVLAVDPEKPAVGLSIVFPLAEGFLRAQPSAIHKQTEVVLLWPAVECGVQYIAGPRKHDLFHLLFELLMKSSVVQLARRKAHFQQMFRYRAHLIECFSSHESALRVRRVVVLQDPNRWHQLCHCQLPFCSKLLQFVKV